ncbi:MAG: hypothetical protein HGB20_09720 [Chlorobiaceae bacterium]|nr:hypothetical protein [Chlorobiaceae bacterium]
MKATWNNALQKARPEIFRRWKGSALALFSGAESPSSLITDALLDQMASLLDSLAEDNGDCSDTVDAICRILAVQPFKPSLSMQVFFSLKSIVPELICGQSGDEFSSEGEPARFLSRTDELILMAFDRFMAHRERLYQLKVEESRNRMHMALRRAGV